MSWKENPLDEQAIADRIFGSLSLLSTETAPPDNGGEEEEGSPAELPKEYTRVAMCPSCGEVSTSTVECSVCGCSLVGS